MSILNTWGWIFTYGLFFFEGQEPSGMGLEESSSFDVDKWMQNLFREMNVRFLTSLYTHLDVIALEIFGSAKRKPTPEDMRQLLQKFLEVTRPLVQLIPLSSEQELGSFEFEDSFQEE